MRCPECGGHTHVVSTRPTKGLQQITRRRVCYSCKTRFSTAERVMASSIKRGKMRRDGYAKRETPPHRLVNRDASDQDVRVVQ